MDQTPEQHQKYLKALERIELAGRPEKWRLARKLLFELKPWLVAEEHDHNEACKEIRLKNADKYAASKSLTMSNKMKLYGPVYSTIIKIDPDLKGALSGTNKGLQAEIGKQLWDAFPEYRICRNY